MAETSQTSEQEQQENVRNLLWNILQRPPQQFKFHSFGLEQFVPTSQQQEFINRNVKISVERSVNYAMQTATKSWNQQLYIMRRIRLSSSIAHQVITRSDDFESLATQLVNPYFQGNPATDYGRKMEGAARSSFAFHNRVNVLMCGVVIRDDFPWICCSPDGLLPLTEPTLLEIKCPYKRKGLPIVDRDSKTSFVPYLFYGTNGWTLQQSHAYYTQIQISLFILKVQTCLLFVYSAKDRVQVQVPIDYDFLARTIPKLEWFYCNFLLNALMKKYKFA